VGGPGSQCGSGRAGRSLEPSLGLGQERGRGRRGVGRRSVVNLEKPAISRSSKDKPKDSHLRVQ
jgi:hypothetical protein